MPTPDSRLPTPDSRLPTPDSRLLSRLRAVHRRARWVALGTGLSAAALALLGTCAVTLLLDRLFDLPAIGRFVAALAVAMVASVGLALGVLRVVIRRMDGEAVALRVEGHFGGMESLLISALQFSAAGVGAPGVSRALMEMVERQAVEETGGLNFPSVVGTRDLKRVALAAAAALVLAGAFSAHRPAVVRAWMGRLLHPFDAGRVYPTQTHLTPLTGDLAVPAGDLATVAVRAGGRVPETGLLRTWQAGGETGRLAVRADTADAATFRVRLGPIAEDTWYRFEIGDARTVRRRIEALPRPRLADLILTPRLPAYVRAPDPPPQRLRDVQALRGTEIHLRGQARVPARRDGASSDLRVQRAELILASGSRQPMPVAPDGTITGQFIVRHDDAYQIVLAYDYPSPTRARSDSGVGIWDLGFPTPDSRFPTPDSRSVITVTSDAPVWYPVHAVPDKPPVITMIEPGPTVDVSPVGQVTVTAQIKDDYGVEEAAVWYAVRRAPPARPTGKPERSESGKKGSDRLDGGGLAPFLPPADETGSGPIDRRAFTRVALAGRFGSRRVRVEHVFDIARTGARPGDRILYYLRAADGRQDPPAGGMSQRPPAPDALADKPPVAPADNPNVVESEMYEIAVVSMEEIERQLRQKRQAIWDDIRRLYERERDLRGDVDDLRRPRPTTRPAATDEPPPNRDEMNE